jgi:hypothetical protein
MAAVNPMWLHHMGSRQSMWLHIIRILLCLLRNLLPVDLGQPSIDVAYIFQQVGGMYPQPVGKPGDRGQGDIDLTPFYFSDLASVHVTVGCQLQQTKPFVLPELPHPGAEFFLQDLLFCLCHIEVWLEIAMGA